MATQEHSERRKNSGPAEVRLTDETIEYLEIRVAAAVAQGMKSAMSEETAVAFWSAGLSALKKQANQHAGRFVLGGLWALVSKVGLFFMLAGGVYALGGWSGLAALFKSLFGR